MKTKINLPDTRTLDDIVFENRNKAYGAYALNKKHRKYLVIAFLISLTGVSTAIAVPFLKALNGKDVFNRLDKTVVITIDRYKEDPVIPPPPPTPPPTGLDKQISYKAPVVVENATEDDIPVMTEILGVAHNDAVTDVLPDVIVDAGPEIVEPIDEGLIAPQESASFMNGGLDEFRVWVQQHIVYPSIAVETGITGKVIVAFCVNKKGEVVDIELLRGLDKSVDQETIRVIASSPLWRAARQAGSPCKQKFVIPVSFLLTN